MSRSRSVAGFANRRVNTRGEAADRTAARLSIRAAIALVGGVSLLLWIAALGLGRYVLG